MTKYRLSWRIERHATIASTQTAAIAAARGGEPSRLAVLAAVQTTGRGSRGRGWVSPPGNLNLSVLLRPSGYPDPGHWAMLAGVALHDTLAPYTDGLMLKWPNDLLLGGGKLGGVLIDSGLDADGRVDWVVVGVGANLAVSPCVEGRITACLPPPCPDAAAVADGFLDKLDCWNGADIRSAWLDRAHRAGTLIDVVTPHRRVRGRFAGLSSRGELVLEGVAAPISSAEVFLPAEPYHPPRVSCSLS